MAFPAGFAENVEVLDPDIGERGAAALGNLSSRGYRVVAGMTEELAIDILAMSREPHIAAMCPKDSDLRFANISATAEWLGKNGGRAVFALYDLGAKQAVGYGWTGLGECDELPGHPITSAYRMAEAGKGKKLNVDFVQAIVSATMTRHAEGRGVGLETWASNIPAGKSYLRAGFRLVTLQSGDRVEVREGVEYVVPDTRLFMGYPAELGA